MQLQSAQVKVSETEKQLAAKVISSFMISDFLSDPPLYAP
jgi:hypothetical protein